MTSKSSSALVLVIRSLAMVLCVAASVWPIVGFGGIIHARSVPGFDRFFLAMAAIYAQGIPALVRQGFLFWLLWVGRKERGRLLVAAVVLLALSNLVAVPLLFVAYFA